MSDAAKRRYSFTLGYLTALCGVHINLFIENEPVQSSLLLSSDGYILQDVNGQNLIPKESN